MKHIKMPQRFLENGDTKMIWVILFIGLISSLTIVDPFSFFSSNLNHTILQAITPHVGLVMLTLPIIVYYSLNIMEKNYFVELEKKEERLKDLRLREQILLFLARYRCKGASTIWEITNRSAFSWNNAKFFIERAVSGETITEKHQLGNIPTTKRFSINSKLADIPGSQWRVMILSEEGNLIDVPERLASLEFET